MDLHLLLVNGIFKCLAADLPLATQTAASAGATTPRVAVVPSSLLAKFHWSQNLYLLLLLLSFIFLRNKQNKLISFLFWLLFLSSLPPKSLWSLQQNEKKKFFVCFFSPTRLLSLPTETRKRERKSGLAGLKMFFFLLRVGLFRAAFPPKPLGARGEHLAAKPLLLSWPLH